MSIEELLKVAPPPKKPIQTGPDSLLADVQSRLGIVLPDDLVEFARRYGRGKFGGWLYILTPFAEDFELRVQGNCERMVEMREGDDVPFGVFPDRPGLFPWGGGPNGERMFWLTEGPPKQWPIILHAIGPSEFERWDGMTMTTFLAKALTNEIKCMPWKKFNKRDCVYKPMDY